MSTICNTLFLFGFFQHLQTALVASLCITVLLRCKVHVAKPEVSIPCFRAHASSSLVASGSFLVLLAAGSGQLVRSDRLCAGVRLAGRVELARSLSLSLSLTHTHTTCGHE